VRLEIKLHVPHPPALGALVSDAFHEFIFTHRAHIGAQPQLLGAKDGSVLHVILVGRSSAEIMRLETDLHRWLIARGIQCTEDGEGHAPDEESPHTSALMK